MSVYTECMVAIADAYLSQTINTGTLSVAHWHRLIVKAYRG
jgi:hypothetical protein